jgi:hypothetical protein
LGNGTYVVVKELIVKDEAGSMNFTVDGGWSEMRSASGASAKPM